MALTKVTGQVIKNTTDVTVGVLTVTNTLAVGGTVSIGGTLTYEDVTNIDSVGLITARNGIVVGSGITLSKDGDIFATGITTVSGNVKVGTGITLSPDGDVFFTGIATGNGSGLTALNASNLGSGTVPTARLGSGTASSSTFLRGDSTFATVTSTTINSNANDRIITGSNTANTLNGQSNQNIVAGNLIAGHTASTTVSDGEAPFIQVKGTDSRGGISLLRHSADANGGGVYIGKSRNGTIGSNTIVQDNDELGRVTFSGDDGSDIHTQGAAIKAHIDGTPGSNNMPGRLSFYTNNGDTGVTERIRINANGSVNMHNTSGYNSYSVDVSNAGATDTAVQIRPNDGNAGEAQLFIGGGGTNQNKCAIIFDPAGGYCRGNLHFCMDNTGDTSNVDSSDKKLSISPEGYVTKPNNPSFMAYGDNSWTTLTDGQDVHPYNFNNIAHNIGGHYKNSGTDAGKFIAPVAGVYQLNWNIFVQGTSNQTTSATIEMYVRKNGSTVSRLHNKKGYGNMGDDQEVIHLAVAEQLSANDEITVIFSAYGATWRIYGGHTTFSGYLIG